MKGQKGKPVTVDRQQLEGLAKIHCTFEEMMHFFDCSRDTLENRIREYYDLTVKEFITKYQSQGKVSLRREGFRQALKGDKVMLKFHLENYTGMSNKIENTHTGADGGPIQTITRRIVRVQKDGTED